MIFLIDHNIEGQATLLWSTILVEGWLDLTVIRFTTFEEAGLAIDSSDREVWHFAQENKMIILTANRNMRGDGSLEETIREENTIDSLPVVTVANIERMNERKYRELCAERLVDILIDLDNLLGVGRIFIP